MRGIEQRSSLVCFIIFSISGIGNLQPWQDPSFVAINFLRLGTETKFPLLRKYMPETLTHAQSVFEHTFLKAQSGL